MLNIHVKYRAIRQLTKIPPQLFPSSSLLVFVITFKTGTQSSYRKKLINYARPNYFSLSFNIY